MYFRYCRSDHMADVELTARRTLPATRQADSPIARFGGAQHQDQNDVYWHSGLAGPSMDPQVQQDVDRNDSEATLIPPAGSLTPKHSPTDYTPCPVSGLDTPSRLAAIQRKLDVRLVLFYSMTYLILKVSERNITNVAILNSESQSSNIKIQLGHLTSQQWAWIVSAFFYTYIAFEPASVLLIKKFSPRVWMARIMITWGIISACQASCSNFAGLLTCRILLGLAEAGFMPGVLYHLSFWYPADRLTMRVSVLAACAMFSGTFSGSLAYGISFLNDIGGMAGWRWIFLIEGLPAVALGIVTFLGLPNYPQTANFLNQEEKELIIRNLPTTQPTTESEAWDWQEVKSLVLKDVTFWSFQALWVAHSTGAIGISLALPTITYALELQNSSVSQLLTMPPYALGCGLTLCIGAAIHVTGWRPWAIALVLDTMILVAYVLLLTVDNRVARYCFVVIALASAMAVLPMLWPGESILLSARLTLEN
nr:putative transporter [Quercus suber]